MADRSVSQQATSILLATARNLEQSQQRHTVAAAMHVKDVMNRGISQAGYPPGSSFRNGRVRFRGARFDVRGRVNPTALVRYSPAGPAALWERGSKTHTIVSKKVGGSAVSRGQMQLGPGMFSGTRTYLTPVKGRRKTKVKGQGAVRTPMGMRAYVRHPGQRGHPFFRKVEAQVRKETPEVVMDSLLGQLALVGWRKGYTTSRG